MHAVIALNMTLSNILSYRENYADPRFGSLKFRFISRAENLPDNITMIDAPELSSALPQMFRLAREEESVNFVVWTPPQPVLTQKARIRMGLMRSFNGFEIAANLAINDNNERISIHEQSRWDEILGNHTLKSHLRKHIDAIRLGSHAFLKAKEQFNASSYSLLANNSWKNSLTRVDAFPSFHIDSLRGERYLRLLCAHQGVGTYVIGNSDMEYKKEPEGYIGAQPARKDVTVWIVPQGSYALMKSGGLWEDRAQWKPAYHSWPFRNRFVRSGQKRILERSDFNVSSLNY